MTFDAFRLTPATRQLFAGDVEVHLTPKAFDLLLFLVEHRVRAVSKAELHERLWPATFVSEANLASLVAEVRRALGDQSREPKYIRTVHGFGYAFVGRLADDGAPVTGGRMCWAIVDGREIPLVPGEHIIGRDPAASILLDAPSVSRRHARIVVSPDGAVVEDLESKNGTFIGEASVGAPTPLMDLDQLRVGSVTMIIRVLRGGDSTQTLPS